jgi:site-specific recombinase XerD
MASRLIAQGQQVETVQLLLGHADLTMYGPTWKCRVAAKVE